MRPSIRLCTTLLVLLHSLLGGVPTVAAEIRVAVAANFIEPVKEIGALFTRATGHQTVFSSGATGQLYTQITQDAPFEVFLSADQATPERAIDEGFAVTGTRFTYATGRLVLFSKDPALIKGEATLEEGPFAKLAIANPTTAPYGAAAVEVMKGLGVYDGLAPKFVQGNNIAQTYQFVETGSAELGFVALSQVARHAEGSRWLVSDALHSPIAQDAVLLKRGADSDAARAFLAFLKGPEGRAVVEKFGYGAGN
jgi:molybdate transport system substrate-binding protein